MTTVHDAMVTAQFGARAQAYATSSVHASGDDLLQIAAVARKHGGKRGSMRALDLGCGGGHVSFHLAPHVGEVIAYDLSPDMLKVVAQGAATRGLVNIRTHAGNVETLPFAAGSFDLVVSRYSAHHWRDWQAGLREARRVLKNDGIAVFADTVTVASPLLDTRLQAIELLRDPSHVRNYAVAEWTAALTAAGFVPGAPTLRRIHLEFASWVARMATPETHVRAIRALQALMPKEALDYFEVQADGSFTFDAMTVEATPA